MEITGRNKDRVIQNRDIWKSLRIKKDAAAVFFPASNLLVPIAFAKFMNKRKVTFVDSNEINVSSLISLSARMRLSNVTVKLRNSSGKFPIADGVADLVYSDFGYSNMPTDSRSGLSSDAESLTKELVRIAKSGGRIAALENNGAAVMYPCPKDISAIRSKMDSPHAERLTAGRRIYGLFKAQGLENISLTGYSHFVTKEIQEEFESELSSRIQTIDANREQYSKLGLSSQEIDRYRQWLKSQSMNNSFLFQFNSILTTGQKK